MKVEKRDGTIQSFKFEKIEKAVHNVFCSLGQETPDGFIGQLKEHFFKLVVKHDLKDSDYAMPIEEIQDTIRNFLIKKNHYLAAESFILYRKKREEVREGKSWLTKEIFKKLKGDNIENQNANLDEASFGGRMGEVNSAIMKQYALDYCMSEMARNNHLNNLIYIQTIIITLW